MDTGIRILYYLIFTAEMLILDNILFHDRTKNRGRYLLAGILYIIVMILTIIYNDYYIPPIGACLYVMIFMLLLESRWWQRLLHCLITFLIAGSVETVLTVIMYRIPMYSQYVWPYEYPDILMEGIAVLLSITLVHRKGLKQFLERCKVLKWYQLAAIAMIILGGTSLLVYGIIMNIGSALMWQPKPSAGMLISSLIKGIPFDLVHSISTAIFLLIAGVPILEKLDRVKTKYGI